MVATHNFFWKYDLILLTSASISPAFYFEFLRRSTCNVSVSPFWFNLISTRTYLCECKQVWIHIVRTTLSSNYKISELWTMPFIYTFSQQKLITHGQNWFPPEDHFPTKVILPKITFWRKWFQDLKSAYISPKFWFLVHQYVFFKTQLINKR